MKAKLTFFYFVSVIQLVVLNTVMAEDIKLGGYPFPTTAASFVATEVAADLEFTELTYTDNIMYDYNSQNGYYRPYRWPEGAMNSGSYLEFTVTPKNGATLNPSNLKIVHKPNTATLGPSKISIAYSTDGGENFITTPEVVIASRTSFNTDIIGFSSLSSTQPIIFRLYAYESLYGLETQKDLWIIDYIEVFGSVQEDVSTSIIDSSKHKQVKSYFTDGKLHITGVTEQTKLTVYNMLGKILYAENISADKSISLDYPDQLLIVKMESEKKRWITKIRRN
jgi:hypothetical protein